MHSNQLAHLVHQCLKGRRYILRSCADTLDELEVLQVAHKDDCTWTQKGGALLVLLDGGPGVTLDDLRAKRAELVAAEPMRLLREARNVRLAETDYLANADYPHPTPEARNAWLAYRQALRDLPSRITPCLLQNGTLDTSEFPSRP